MTVSSSVSKSSGFQPEWINDGSNFNEFAINEIFTSVIINSDDILVFSFKLDREIILNPNRAYESVIEFAPEEALNAAEININKIEDKEHKLELLKAAIIEGKWDDPLFDQINENLEGVVRGALFEFPFIALYGLRQGVISKEEFFLIQAYYGLRDEFSKDEIQVCKILDKNKEITQEAFAILKQCLSQNLTVQGQKLNFTKLELNRYISSLKEHVRPHEMILFSVPNQPFPNPHISENLSSSQMQFFGKMSVWDSFRGKNHHICIFNNKIQQYVPSLIAYQKFLTILYPHAGNVTLTARIGFTPSERQAERGDGYFDILIPFPTFFPVMADGYPTPGLEVTYHDMLGHALIFFSIPGTWRKQLYTMLVKLREFEASHNHLNAEDEKIRYRVTDSAFDLDAPCFEVFEKKPEIKFSDLLNRINFFQETYLKNWASRFKNTKWKDFLNEEIDRLCAEWKDQIIPEKKSGCFIC